MLSPLIVAFTLVGADGLEGCSLPPDPPDPLLLIVADAVLEKALSIPLLIAVILK